MNRGSEINPQIKLDSVFTFKEQPKTSHPNLDLLRSRRLK